MAPAVAPVPCTDFPWPAGVRGAVSLTFDDARPSQLDYGVPLFNRHGARATFYASIGALRQRQADWRAAIAAGHEVGAHTLSHTCTGNFHFSAAKAKHLENMTLEQMETEFIESNARIEELVGVKPVSFAYPCGQFHVGRGENLRSYAPLVARHYLTGRGWRDEYFNAPDRCELALLGGIEFDDLDFAAVRPQLDEAAASGTWLVLAGHDIGLENPRQVTRVATLEAICEYCADPANGIWLDTVGNIAGWIGDHRQPLS